MAEEQVELQPLVKGAVTVPDGKREKYDFPVTKPFQVHITGAKFGVFQKTVERDGEEVVIDQTKVIYNFEIDSDIQDTVTKKDLKGKSFAKGITLSKHERATYPGFITAVTGAYTDDPSEALDKPLQVMFAAKATFNGQDYQPITYLPPAEGQEAPKKDVVITDPDEIDKIISEHDLFGPAKEA